MEEESDNTELWLTWNDHAQILKSVLSTLRYKELYADVTLVCGTKQYAVHRFILATCSAYFEKLLETIPGQHPVVVLTNTSPKDLEALLDFMYLGQTEVNSTDLDRLLDVAYEFRIRGLISARDDPEVQSDGVVYDEASETPKIEYTEAPENDESVVDSYPMPASDPLNTMGDSQDEEIVEPTHNGAEPEETYIEEPTIIKDMKVEEKIEEDIKQPAVDSGLKEYQNFIQKLMQENEEAESLSPAPVPSVPEKSCVIEKKVPKHHDTKFKKGKCKSKIEKLKSDMKKQKEKLAKNKMENLKEKVKSVRNTDDTKTKIMMCPGCKKTFMCQSVLEDHMKTHDDLEIVSCAKCPFKALSQQQMQKHMLTHQQRIEQKSRPYQCPYCPARQVDRSSFLRHQKTLHPDKKLLDSVMNAKVVLEDCKYKKIRPNKVEKELVPS
ncbi:zinc finger and BTB domain-containing protein 14-like [Macrobrachium rosenbergii]|uniref:zinc finger and BTB domain-containing protein 14-like n=1 Tax=Macrobrachium rosenbergii TaxID=79674 RepID=UPI0034D3937D